MYEKVMSVPEYAITAENMANEICNFEPEHQNIMLNQIKQTIIERRKSKIESLKKDAEYLEISLRDI